MRYVTASATGGPRQQSETARAPLTDQVSSSTTRRGSANDDIPPPSPPGQDRRATSLRMRQGHAADGRFVRDSHGARRLGKMPRLLIPSRADSSHRGCRRGGSPSPRERSAAPRQPFNRVAKATAPVAWLFPANVRLGALIRQRWSSRMYVRTGNSSRARSEAC